VRGLDYYNRTVFEWVTDQLGAQGTVCAGGRYDGLIEQLGGKPAPAAGFAMGIERLLSLMEVAGTPLSTPVPDAYIVHAGDAAQAYAWQVASALRGAGLATVLHCGGGSFKSQMKKADASRARYAVIIGDDEAAAQQVTLKPLRGTAEQTRVELTLAIETLKQASTYDLDEQERLDELKAWWKRWGNLVMFGLAVVIALAAGWRYWQNHTATQSLEAATVYEKLTQSLAANDAKAAREAGAMLIEQYEGTAYAPRAALLLAKLNVGAKDLKSAQTQLEWAVAHSKEPAVKDLARLRLAAVQLDQNQNEAALKTLSATHSDAFAFRFHDLKGDVLLAQGKPAEARAAYQAAFAKMTEDNPYRNIVELKLDALGGAAK
jgi:predicted negative regulator of RcsB-dependent stress response